MRERHPRWLLGLWLLSAIGCAVTLRADEAARQNATATSAAVARSTPLDLASPDALIVTKRLSRLPRDILTIPLLKSFLTEDFLYYYEQREGFLGFKGALRRISFEHDLRFEDELLAYLMDTPAEVALWRGGDGKLDHFMVVLNQSGLKTLIESVAKVALDDRQLSKLPGSEDRYVLRFGAGRELYLAVVEDRLYLLSDPETPLPSAKQTEKWKDRLGRFFGTSQEVGVFAPLFGLGGNGAAHTLVFSLSYVSFGYQHLFPGLKALRFDFQKDGWHTSWLADTSPDFTDTSALWKALPRSPALCLTIPLDKQVMGTLLDAEFIDDKSGNQQLLQSLNGPLALCWYAKSKLFAPLVVIRGSLESPAQVKLADAFKILTGTSEAGELSPQATPKGGVGPVPKALHRHEPFAVVAQQGKGGTLWTREISSRYGLYESGTSLNAAKMRSPRFFRAAVAAWRGFLVFSPDDRLVRDVMAVLDKRYPAIDDSLTEHGPGLVLYPGRLGELLKESVQDSLPSSQESLFRESVSRYLFPAFERLEQFHGFSMSLPKVAEGNSGQPGLRWGEAKWKSLSGS